MEVLNQVESKLAISQSSSDISFLHVHVTTHRLNFLSKFVYETPQFYCMHFYGTIVSGKL